MQSDIYIPKALSSYALTNGVHREFRLFVYMKMSCSGKTMIDKEYVYKACKDLEFTRGTFYRLLSKLKDMDWVCKSHSGYYFIKGFALLLKQLNLEGRTCTYFISEWFNRFKAFLSGSVIGYLVKHQRKAEQKKGRSNKLCPVATLALSKILNVPESTAYLLKRIASTYNFITKKRDFTNTGIHYSYISEYRKVNPDTAHKTIIKNGCIQICNPDLCSEVLKYKIKRYRG